MEAVDGHVAAFEEIPYLRLQPHGRRVGIGPTGQLYPRLDVPVKVRRRVADELVRRYPRLTIHLRMLTLELRAGKARRRTIIDGVARMARKLSSRLISPT